MDKHQAQEAEAAAREALHRAGGPAYVRLDASMKPTVCLSRNLLNRGELPASARITLMSESVARALAIFGLQAPVSLTNLTGLWWVARVDAAHIHDNLEFGGAYCTLVAGTEELIHRYSDGYAEVTRGPFATREEASASLVLG